MSSRVRSLRSSLLAITIAFAAFVVASLTHERIASADRRSESAAQTALKKADDDYLQSDFAKALRRLVTAERACGEASCTAPTHAALLRDIGTMQFRLAQPEAAASSFRRAKKLDPSIALNPDYDTKDLREAWDAALVSPAAAPASPAAPGAPVAAGASGDFTHRPAAAQSVSTPLPVYVETTNADVASVVVKYKNDAMRSYRRAVLTKAAGAGSGWGGTIPCADVAQGTVRYYIQGFDKDGELAASSGDPNHTFDVPIRAKIEGDPPSLPGQSPPLKCTEQDVQVLNLDEGERCKEDRQCKSGTCSSGSCKAVQSFEQEEPAVGARGGRQLARFWVGVSGALDLTSPSSGSEVCAQTAAVSSSGYWCTTPEGRDLTPQETAALVPGHRGAASGELTPGGVHILATFDYAATANLFVGVRLGYVANAYPGDAASSAGKTIGSAIHAELRGTWVFGDEPIARSGLAPYVFVSGGVARFDTPVTVMVATQAVAGERAVRAWYVAGPAFGAAGGGARYAFSPRVAFATGLGLHAAFAPGAFGFAVSPEMSLQYGF
jgi:hypothetical protein